MLQRISADRFAAPAGRKIQLVLRSSQNNGINSGAFHYAGLPLDGETIQGLPGCSLVPVEGVEQFRVHVDFHPAAASARYNLFEIDQDNGATIDLNERRLASDPDAIIGFGISGIPLAVFADAPAPEGAPLARSAKKKTATKKAAKKKKAKVATIAAKKSKSKSKKKSKSKSESNTKSRSKSKSKTKSKAKAKKMRKKAKKKAG